MLRKGYDVAEMNNLILLRSRGPLVLAGFVVAGRTPAIVE
jgi:hypothetical protein